MTESVRVFQLRFVTGKYVGEEFSLTGKSGLLAGRTSVADLVLADDTVSRRHARFYLERGRTWVRDLGSRNGTWINGERIEYHCLREGDRLALGSSLCRVTEVESTQSRPKLAGEKRKIEAAQGSMSGTLEEISLFDVLQWLGTSRKTGILRVRGADQGRSGEVHLRDGQAFFACIDGSTLPHPEKALIRMLSWQSGKFALDSTTVSEVPQEVGRPLEHLIMEAARQQDELARLRGEVGLPEEGDKLRVVMPAPSRWRSLNPDELDLLQSLIEGADFWALRDRSSDDDLSLWERLGGLRRRGLIDW